MSRALAVLSGLAVLAFVWSGAPLALTSGPFAAHMTMHMGVVAVASPLLACGLARGPFDPTRWAPGVFSPIPMSIVELVAVWVWHTPALHAIARHSPAGTILEQGTFLASGLAVWFSALGGTRDDRARAGAGVVALLLTSMHMTLLGALLALPPRPLYAHGSPTSEAGQLDDQHLGGAIMLVVGGVSYLAGGLALLTGVLRDRRAPKEVPCDGRC